MTEIPSLSHDWATNSCQMQRLVHTGCLVNHWCQWSIIFYFTTQIITLHNSSAQTARNAGKLLRSLKTLVEAEVYTTYHHPIWSWDTWSVIGPENSPKQGNDYDCGVFMCMAITHTVMGATPEFSQSDITTCRQHMAKRILANQYCRLGRGAQSPPTGIATRTVERTKTGHTREHTQGR